MDVALFALSGLVGRFLAWHGGSGSTLDTDDDDDDSLYYVTPDNEEWETDNHPNHNHSNHNTSLWHRATYVLIMHDPPDMFYEPKEWSHTSVLLAKVRPSRHVRRHDHNNDNDNDDTSTIMAVPGGPLRAHESHVDCGVRLLLRDWGIDVRQPENCLHHLFTFQYDSSSSKSNNPTNNNDIVKQWADFMECVFRGSLDDLSLPHPHNLVRLSLADLRDLVTESPEVFHPESCYAIKLYFQRQMDLRAQRRLLKGYSSMDMEKYGLRDNATTTTTTSQHHKPIVFMADQEDSERGSALDYTMKTDDGMSPRLLLQADVVLLGVSRAGKTPMSLLLSQTKGLKVANIPLVLEVAPPPQLHHVDARKVFLITQHADHLCHVRRERLRRELKHHRRGGVGMTRSTYADPDYVRRDLDHARTLARDRGYTIVDITDRAMEEAASLIMSKLKERFPDQDFGDPSM